MVTTVGVSVAIWVSRGEAREAVEMARVAVGMAVVVTVNVYEACGCVASACVASAYGASAHAASVYVNWRVVVRSQPSSRGRRRTSAFVSESFCSVP
jgi:hypothetical protein